MNTKRPSRIVRIFLPIVLGVMTGAGLAENIDPANDGSQYAWSENLGWLNARPGGPGGPGVQVNDFDLTGWIWAENAGWISLWCGNTDSCFSVGYGVRNDGAGHLSGFAWSENAGWISFSCADTGSCATAPFIVTIDPATGVFDGFAWGENVGWISFRSTGSAPFTLTTAWRCSPAPPIPAGVPQLELTTLPAGETMLSWTGIAGATGYDVVSGDLGALQASGGSFASSTTQCLAQRIAGPPLPFAATPPAGKGFWFLVWGVNCGGHGTYDSGAPSQVGSRDPGIAASGHDCP